MNVPFLDLKAQYVSIKPDIDAAIQSVIDQTSFAGGPFVSRFEEAFAAYCQAPCAATVGNGTDALWLALWALGVGPGDEVITAPNTFIATVEAISLCGAKPVFVDADERTYTINPSLIEAAITPRTKVIIPVHLYGQTADMDPILAIARKHHLLVVEDACQAHGAEYKGRRAGTMGAAGCFSFYPGKNLGAYGEGGAVVSNDKELIDKIKLLREHGSSVKYVHKIVGCNARLDSLQCAILQVKLKHLDGWNERRRAHAAAYRRLLQGAPGIRLPSEAGYARHIYHIFPVRVRNRDQILKALAERGVHGGIHYPIPVHLSEAYQHLGLPPGSFPVTEACAGELLSLPMYPELTEEQIVLTAEALKKLASV
ncbi:MAG: DegT/DnrJ/EryC1/StrS family aminotransferase [Lentisphaerota bacterium]